MEINISKWGNSLGIRIPKNILNDLCIKEGDSLNIEVKNNEIVLRKNKYDEFIIKDLAEQYYGKPFNKLENIICEKEIDYGQAQGDEEW